MAQHPQIAAHTMVGFRLCTAGHAELYLNGKSYPAQRGTLHVQSPILHAQVLTVSDDYAEVAFLFDLQSIFPLFQRMVRHIVQLDVLHHPVLQLSEADTTLYIERSTLLERQRRQHAAAPDELHAKLLDTWIETFVQHVAVDTITRFLHAQQHLPEAHPIHPNESVVSTFLMLLNMHFRQERSVSFYAQRLGYSTGHFSALVKQHTQRTPSEWIATVTMTEARTLIAHSDLSIKEISAELGFPEQFTFRKYFKLHEGLSPREYRKQQQATTQ